MASLGGGVDAREVITEKGEVVMKVGRRFGLVIVKVVLFVLLVVGAVAAPAAVSRSAEPPDAPLMAPIMGSGSMS
jgi:hypothetical protein